MIRELVLYIFIILLIIQIVQKNSDFMDFLDFFEFNIKMLLISKAGISIQNPKGIKVMLNLSSDPLLIKTHRKFNKKYGRYVRTHIISSTKNYYILDSKLTSQILSDSPHLFGPGVFKEDFFQKFMPYNIAVAPCYSESECPWKKLRKYNEDVLGTNNWILFFNCIYPMIDNRINNAPLKQKDFEKLSYNIVSDLIFGIKNNLPDLLQKYFHLPKDENFVKNKFYNQYNKILKESYQKAPKCSLLYYSDKFNKFKDNIRDDQIPHFFVPFIFIINYLIPNLMCIIYNFPEIHNKLMLEIKNEKVDVEKYLMSKNTYLHFCVVEHIRLFNLLNINIQRKAKKDMNYYGINFKKGDQIFLLFSSILRDENRFKNPDVFLPERWENKSIKQQEFVFGIGPQRCPSKEITPMVYKNIIYQILVKFKLQVVKPKLKTREIFYINPYEIEFK